jgi:hypothetical protein
MQIHGSSVYILNHIFTTINRRYTKGLHRSPYMNEVKNMNWLNELLPLGVAVHRSDELDSIKEISNLENDLKSIINPIPEILHTIVINYNILHRNVVNFSTTDFAI